MFRKKPSTKSDKPEIPPYDRKYRVTFNDGTSEIVECHAYWTNNNGTTDFVAISDYFWSDGDPWSLYEQGWNPNYGIIIKRFSTTGYRSIERV